MPVSSRDTDKQGRVSNCSNNSLAELNDIGVSNVRTLSIPRYVPWLISGIVLAASALILKAPQEETFLTTNSQEAPIASMRTKLWSSGPEFIVQKSKLGNGILLEIFEALPTDQMGLEVKPGKLLAQTEILEALDAHIEFHGKYSNLAVIDSRPGQDFEIVVPVLDASLLTRIHSFQFDPSGPAIKALNSSDF